MKAFVHVFAHPYFAISATDGSFEIRNVPPGSFTLVAWQEKYGILRLPIVVSNGNATPASFTFQSGL
jgi:hypothetical protein